MATASTIASRIVQLYIAAQSGNQNGNPVSDPMKNRLLFSLLFLASVLAPGIVTFAHHGTRAAYIVDPAKERSLTGTVTRFRWGNPHVYVLFDVTDEKGNVVHWGAETRPPFVMAKHGWSRDTMKPGDQITITIFPAKAGGPYGLMSKVFINGKLVLDDEQTRLQTDTDNQ
jgi:hypothetical protein